MLQGGGGRAQAAKKSVIWTMEQRNGAEDSFIAEPDKQICPHAAPTGLGGSPATAMTTTAAQTVSQKTKSSPQQQPCTKIATGQTEPTTDH